MGFKVEIGGFVHELESYQVQEAATPLAAGDSSGQVGTITLTLKKPDLDVPGFDTKLRKYGPHLLIHRDVRLTDTRKGFTVGKSTAVSDPRSSGTFTVTCESRLGLLNVYGVQAQPFIGRLEDAFIYYCSVAGVTTDVFVDEEIRNKLVIFPGFNGELWYNLKQITAAIDVDISLVSGVILLRPIRKRIAASDRDIDRNLNVGGNIAQAVEVARYQNRRVTNALVYPPGGWSETVAPITVNAGEYVEQVLELNTSLSSIQQPIMQTFVSQNHNSSSVYTIVGDDGLPIQPAAWAAYGGSLTVEINEDTKSLTVKIQAASGLPTSSGELIGTFGVALAADSSTGRYSTLRIIGSGVGFEKEIIRFPTGVPASETGTEVGVTIDNPFISTLEEAYRAGTRAATAYSGRDVSITGSVIAVNRLGDSGDATYPTYDFVQGLHAGKTYDQVTAGYAGKTYDQIQADLFQLVQSNFENQVFGNVNGARVYDRRSSRWYRIRSGSLTMDAIQFEADDDLTFADVQKILQGSTYNQEKNFFLDCTYEERHLAGLQKVS